MLVVKKFGGSSVADKERIFNVANRCKMCIRDSGQRDPKVEYKMLGYEMFDAMTKSIEEDTVRTLLHIKLEQKVEREQVAKVTGTNKDDSAVKEPKKRAEKKVYPNDPCPCGSGKKYKQCCGRK